MDGVVGEDGFVGVMWVTNRNRIVAGLVGQTRSHEEHEAVHEEA